MVAWVMTPIRLVFQKCYDIWCGYSLTFFSSLLGVICEVNTDCKHCIGYVRWKRKICNYSFDETHRDCHPVDFWWSKLLGRDWARAKDIRSIRASTGFVFISCPLCFHSLHKVIIFFLLHFLCKFSNLVKYKI